jgi:hypothetical protein
VFDSVIILSAKMPIKSDLQRIDRMSDEDIDYSDIPPLTDEQLAAMRPLRELLPEVAHKKSHRCREGIK